MNEPVIAVRGLATRFGALSVHEDLDLDVMRGEVLALVGGSGSGKTTLLREMIMLETPAAGSVKLFGRQTLGASSAQAFALRRRFGVLFQMGALFSSLTVAENVAVPLREHAQISATLIDRIARFKIALAGLPAHAAERYPGQLSGGMIKRAALARALALDPELLFLDEPTAGLDPASAAAFDELIVQLKNALGLTVIMVTHDIDSLWQATDRVAFLGERRVLACEPMSELTRSDHPLIRAYFDNARGARRA